MRNSLRIILTSLALLLVVLSIVYITILANRLEQEERAKMEIWAEATRQFIMSDNSSDIAFYSKIMEQNTTIPVYMTDTNGHFLLSRNVREPKHHIGDFYQHKIAELRATQEPIEVKIGKDVVQYIYYDESTLLQQLRYFPYVQVSLILIFIGLMVYLLYVSRKNDENRLWVGLTRETAHQLGTPITSLVGWKEILAEKYPQEEAIPQMGKDLLRLQTIVGRFSKVSAMPKLRKVPVLQCVNEMVEYMQTRVGRRVSICVVSKLHNAQQELSLNGELFGWVIENLIRNAVDAMGGDGTIIFTLLEDKRNVYIDCSDTGRGMDRMSARHAFNAGYTTKDRGWGLGLSLCKRIIERYHHGRISLRSTEVGVGTTFRISMKKI